MDSKPLCVMLAPLQSSDAAGGSTGGPGTSLCSPHRHWLVVLQDREHGAVEGRRSSRQATDLHDAAPLS
eukprot:7618483-Pyramimonas_sp.AAC.1